MSTTYYTVADLNLVPGRLPHRDCNTQIFQTLDDAIRDYRSLPDTSQKSLGIAHNFTVQEFVRCIPRFGPDQPGEDVLLTEHLPFHVPSWFQSIMHDMQSCEDAFNLRYFMEGKILYPLPEDKALPPALQDKLLWLDQQRHLNSAIRWISVSGSGWIPYRPACLDSKAFPLVMECVADGITTQGEYLSLKLTPWEYRMLYFKTIKEQKAGGSPV